MNPIATLLRRAGPKGLMALMVAFVVLSMIGALSFQHVLHLEPCPLCVVQRMAVIGVGVFALIGAVAPGARGQLLAAVLAGAMAIAGSAVAAWHSWILAFPPESLSCGRPFQWFHEDFPLATWLPKLFAGEGDCLKTDWTFLGLAIPHLALIAFALLLAGAVLAVREAWRRGRPGAI
jgi:disulfide bond formation protein DsbB